VPGCSGGKGLLGMSATILYQCVGISDSSKVIFLCCDMWFYFWFQGNEKQGKDKTESKAWN
jgi:hypothetical protein